MIEIGWSLIKPEVKKMREINGDISLRCDGCNGLFKIKAEYVIDGGSNCPYCSKEVIIKGLIEEVETKA